MTVLEVITANALAAVHAVHRLEGLHHAVDRGQHIRGVSGLGNRMHVTDRETDRRGSTVDTGEHRCHRIRAGVPAGEINLIRNLLSPAGLFDQVVEILTRD